MTLRVGLAGRAESGEDGADRAVGRRGERSSAAVLLLLPAVGMAPSIVSVWVVETGRGGTVASVLSCLGSGSLALHQWLWPLSRCHVSVVSLDRVGFGGLMDRVREMARATGPVSMWRACCLEGHVELSLPFFCPAGDVE